MDLSTIRLQGPSGITKANKQGRRPGKIACTACHARKKRCDISPPYKQCTHCRKEGQACIPRDSIDRLNRQQLSNRNHNSQKACNKREPQLQVNSYLPRETDHEIPPWSSMYSFYSEMRRLLPSLTSTSTSTSTSTFPPSPGIGEGITHIRNTPNERRQNVYSSGLDSPGSFQSDLFYGDCVEVKGISIPASRSQSRSLSPMPADTRIGWENALAREAEILNGGLASPEEEKVPGEDSLSAYQVFMNDLDALLRF